MKPKTVQAVYTGGGIWLFVGTTTDDHYFLMDDYGCVLILDADPDKDWENCCYEEWQQKHLIEELFEDKRVAFCMEVIKKLRSTTSSAVRGGITDEEIDYYEDYWPKPM